MASFTFPKVDIKLPGSSMRDLSCDKLTSFAAGPLYPILLLDILPGDNIRLKLDALVESFPMYAPALGSWKASFDVYFEPWSNLYGFMDNNTKLSTQSIIDRLRHTFRAGVDKASSEESLSETFIDDNASHQGSIYDYLGVPNGYLGNVITRSNSGVDYVQLQTTQHPAEGLLSYIDVVRRFYVNPQQTFIPYCKRTPEKVSLSEDTYLSLYQQAYGVTSLATLDGVYQWLRNLPDGVCLDDVLKDTTGLQMSAGATNYVNVQQFGYYFKYIQENKYPLTGLFLRTYKMDLLRGMLSNQVGNVKSNIRADASGNISIDTIRFQNKLQKLIDRIDLSGGRFSDWVKTRWGVTPKGNIDEPYYLGSFSKVIRQTDIISTAGATDENVSAGASGLGQQAGFSVGRFNGSRPIHFKATEYGTLVVIFSMVPYVDYSQGFELNMLKTRFADIYDPAFSQLGYQPVSRFELSALPSGHIDQNGNLYIDDGCAKSQTVGKRVAWSEYMAGLNRVHGLFSYGESLDYWAFNRLYTTDLNRTDATSIEIPDVFRRYGYFNDSSYCYPHLWNRLFADKSLGAQNFRLQVHFDISARRGIGKRLLGHL